MESKQLFDKYVEGVGGRSAAASRLGVSVGMVGHIQTGRRGVSVGIAKRIEADTHGDFTRYQLRPDVFGPAQLPHNRSRRSPVPDSKDPASRPNDDGHVGGADSSE